MDRGLAGAPMVAVVVDEWGVVRQGLRALLERAGMCTAAQVPTATAVRAAVADHRPDVLIVGSCADGRAVDVIRDAQAVVPDVHVMVLVSTADQAAIMDLFTAGAGAVVPRHASEDEVLDAIEHARRGERFLAPALLAAMFDGPRIRRLPTAAGCSRLTAREHAVLRLVAAGRTNRQIAEELCIGAETVKTHLTNIYVKLSVNRRHEAVAVALEEGLL